MGAAMTDRPGEIGDGARTNKSGNHMAQEIVLSFKFKVRRLRPRLVLDGSGWVGPVASHCLGLFGLQPQHHAGSWSLLCLQPREW